MRIEDGFSASGDLRSHSVDRAAETRVDAGPRGRRPDHAADSASLSALSVELSRALGQEPPELLTKIGRLQEAVANGTYSVPSSEISTMIVASALAGDS